MGDAFDVVQPPVPRAARDKRGVPLARERRGWREVPRMCRSGGASRRANVSRGSRRQAGHAASGRVGIFQQAPSVL